MLEEAQIVSAIAKNIFGGGLVALYLCGSFVSGGLQPQSDVDILVVIDTPMTPQMRRSLLAALLDVSGRHPRTPDAPRCIELTVLLKSDLAAPSFPAWSEFVYGEWLRKSFESGAVPARFADPGITLLLAQARRECMPLLGPALADLLAEIPADDVRRAMRQALPALVESLAGDERNVLLTLARIWRTAVTGTFVSKDAAAEWAVPRLPAALGPVLQYAGQAYLGTITDAWTDRAAEAQQASAYLHRAVLAALER